MYFLRVKWNFCPNHFPFLAQVPHLQWKPTVGFAFSNKIAPQFSCKPFSCCQSYAFSGTYSIPFTNFYVSSLSAVTCEQVTQKQNAHQKSNTDRQNPTLDIFIRLMEQPRGSTPGTAGSKFWLSSFIPISKEELWTWGSWTEVIWQVSQNQ